MSQERERRWRMILGQAPITDEEEGQAGDGDALPDDGSGEGGLSQTDRQLDQMLNQLYGDSQEGDLGDSMPDIARWLGDIRETYPTSVVQIVQRDLFDRFKRRKLLTNPELLHEIEPDVALVADLLKLRRMLPPKTKESARIVIQQVVDELIAKLERPLQQSIKGALNRSMVTRRPKHTDINWHRTIRRNLKHYQPRYNTIVAESIIGYGRKRSSLHDIILLVDTSASMGQSVVYAGIYGSVMASMPSITTKMIMFDVNVVDLTDQLDDPVDLIFGIKLGGGTNIDRAITYARQQIHRPAETTVILISDLFEGGNKAGMIEQAGQLVESGVQLIVLLALDDKGAPRFDRTIAQQLADLRVPSFACTPDQFPELMGAVLNGRDIAQYAARVGNG